ncbi:chalcone isomerase family protein [Mitsuaria sp. WAJ17]|uniref:chalcone isomerase family protein n=1 Tax=Mitsuaria sp. WAJ17 TaxID=2761452 RepID=UPI00160219B9|nr:chalcone isomerase family protein [Mitsuaria sp. WAJ17]MBB2485186.1 chalcone isomerase family protein [Mitsuaria sp. WAJ17]
MRRLILAALVALALPLGAQAQAVELAGVKYEPQAELGGQKLVLNGAGIRYKAIFKVYTAGLYLKDKAGTPDGVFTMSGPKRLSIHMLREIDANELGKLFTKGMQDNASPEDFSKSIPGVMRIAEVFAAKKKMSSGEGFAVDFVPGTGTVISVNGKVQGEPIREPEFFTTLMRIWLGKNPADSQLKDALLGIQPQGRSR